MAHELAKRGNTAEAIENYRAALKIDPKLPGLHFELAEMLSTLSTAPGRQEAEKEYKAALEANPSDEQAECRLGDIALQKDDFQEAWPTLQPGLYSCSRAIRKQTSDMAKVYHEYGPTAESGAASATSSQSSTRQLLAHFRLGAVYRQTGRPAEAKHELEEYQKYKEMKEKLRTIYHDLHQDQRWTSVETNPKTIVERLSGAGDFRNWFVSKRSRMRRHF